MPAQPAAVAGRPAARAGGLHPRTAGDQAVGAGRGKVTLCLTACSLCPLGLSVTSFYNCLQSFCGDSPTISYSCRRDALPELLASVRRRLARFTAEQLRELDDFAQEAGLQVGAAGLFGGCAAARRRCMAWSLYVQTHSNRPALREPVMCRWHCLALPHTSAYLSAHAPTLLAGRGAANLHSGRRGRRGAVTGRRGRSCWQRRRGHAVCGAAAEPGAAGGRHGRHSRQGLAGCWLGQ